jgi:pimeloyl-ACP methyl ester carboxylesterase
MVQQNLVVLTPARHEPAFLLHLPGIGGHRNIDDHMAAGFVQGGFTGQVQIYDWTEQDIGLDALFALKRNHAEAKKVARLLTERFDLDPTAPIYLTCHSGGGGIAIWALEELPARIKISALVMMSPALSPGYDLSKALSHVSGKAYVFSSTEDSLVLGTGCQLMGTIDGVKTDAAGRVGFKMPPTADVGQYAKLVSVPYNAEWIRLGDHGDHIGAMSRRFNQLVIAPLVLSGRMPPQSAQEVMALAGSIQTPAAQSPTALSNSALPESLKQSTSHN